MTRKEHKKTLKAEHIGMSSTSAWAAHTSAPRETMAHKMSAQSVVLVGGGDVVNILTGAEELYQTFDVKMPEDGVPVAVISKYPNQVAGQWNETLVIFQRNDGSYDCLELTPYFFHHNEFGYPYVPQQAYERLSKSGSRMPGFKKGEVFLDSPNRKPDGSYGSGRALNVCSIYHPSVGDDAIGISESAAKKLAYYSFERHTVQIGADDVMLNVHGDDSVYKVLPDLGDKVPDNNLLMATRAYRGATALTDMSFAGLRRIEEATDSMYVARPNSVVVGIDVILNPSQSTWAMQGVHDQVSRYWDYTIQYCEKIQAFHKQYVLGPRADSEPRRKISDALARNIRKALVHLQPPSIQRMYRAAPLPWAMVTVTTMAISIPENGAKLVGALRSADKGVIRIIPDDEMPVSAHGIRAEVLMSPDAPFGRMTLGPPHELMYNAASRDIFMHFKREYGMLRYGSLRDYQKVIDAHPRRADIMDDCAKYLRMISDESLDAWNAMSFEQKLEWMAHAFSTELPQYILTIDRQGDEIERSKRVINGVFPGVLVDAPVTFMYKGVLHTTKDNIIIGKRFIQPLEQSARDVSAVHSGVSKVTGMPAHRTPGRTYNPGVNATTVRIGGTEVRVIAGVSGRTYPDRDRRRIDPPGTMLAELAERNGSRTVHVATVLRILNAEEPGRIEEMIDRNEIPYGSSRACGIYTSLALSQGSRYVAEGDNDA